MAKSRVVTHIRRVLGKSLLNSLRRHHSDVSISGRAAVKWKLMGLLRRMRPVIPFVVNSVWAMPAAVFILMLRRWRIIRIGDIDNRWIGHLIVDTAEHVAREREDTDGAIYLYYLLSRKSLNREWEMMLRRELTIVTSLMRYVVPWLRIVPGSQVHILPSARGGRRDVDGLYAQRDCTLKLREGARLQAINWMHSLGWSEGEPFVCLQVRDPAYRNRVLLQGGLPRDVRALLAYDASHRDSEIKTYEAAIMWLLAEGFWVFRMGREANMRLAISHPRLIDYPHLPQKSDVLDIWLFTNCAAVITTGSGPDALSSLYRRPALFVNFVPFGAFSSYTDSMTVPKNLRWNSSGAQLSISEMLTHCHDRSLDYSRFGISVVDLTSEQILMAVQEFFSSLNRVSDFPHDETERSLVIWQHIKSWSDFNRYHKWIHPRARFSQSWLQEQPEDFFQ
jgi:putative glycosyltransferase (TIGR04372 family)